MTTEQKTLTPLQERALELSVLNKQWLQWFMEDTLDKMPGFIAGAVRVMAKKQLGLERTELWKIVPYVVEGMNPESFDNFCSFLREFLTE